MSNSEVKYIFLDSDEITNKQGNDSVYVEVQQDLMRADESKGEYIDMELVSFNCRNDFYQMNDSNNAFGIVKNGNTTLYTLRNGFPSVLSIDNEIKVDLEIETGETWSVIYDNYTGLITMSSNFSGVVPSDLALDFSVANSCNKMIGFDNIIYPFSVNGSIVSLTAPKSVNLSSRIKALNIRTSLIEDNFEADINGVRNSDILGIVPVAVPPLDYIELQPQPDLFKSHISSHKVSSFFVRITDEAGNPAGLNSGFQATFRFTRVRPSTEQSNKYLREMLEIQQLKWLKKDQKERMGITGV